MSEVDWSTPEGLAAITTYLGGRIPDWRAPVAHALALSPATSSPEWEFAHVNAPGGRHALPAVILATVLGHDGSTATLEVSRSDLQEAVASLQLLVEVEMVRLLIAETSFFSVKVRVPETTEALAGIALSQICLLYTSDAADE